MNKLFPCLLLVVMAVALISCEEQADGPPIIGKKDLQLTSDIMTPEVLWSFGRVSDIQVSPDNKMVLFGISYYDKEQNKGNRDLYTIPVEGGEMKMLTHSRANEFNAIWRPDGKKIGYITSESGSLQIWEMKPDGSGKKQISDFEGGITGFKYSPRPSSPSFSRGLCTV